MKGSYKRETPKPQNSRGDEASMFASFPLPSTPLLLDSLTSSLMTKDLDGYNTCHHVVNLVMLWLEAPAMDIALRALHGEDSRIID